MRDDNRIPQPDSRPAGPVLDKPRRRRRLPAMPRWFRRYFFWAWLSLLMLIALFGYLRYAISGNWTPEHLLRVFLPGVF